MPLCLVAAGKMTAFAVTAFTLSWTHSVEKTRWEEDWRIAGDRMQIVEARVKGSGAGMEPPEGAVFANGWWVYAPELAPLKELVLATSGATAGGWDLCFGETCVSVGKEAGEPARLGVCAGP